jgi:hypothetical protein
MYQVGGWERERNYFILNIHVFVNIDL